jgi:hypothetical protein
MDLEKTNQWLTLLTNIGVLIGLLLLVFELNQNRELMRAQMHASRAEAKATRQIEQANSGEMIRIMYTAYAAGFPNDPNALETLSGEDRFRFGAFLAALNEVVQNWHFQCEQDLLDPDMCAAGYESQLRNLISMSHALGADFSNNMPTFIGDVRRVAAESGLPIPREDGRWPD